MSVIQKGEELLVRQKQQQEILEEELKQEKQQQIEAKFKEEAARHHRIPILSILYRMIPWVEVDMVSTRAIPGVFINTKVAGTTDLEHYLKVNRNVCSFLQR